jgi:BlaI family transcriptional regulator, penicillinase repressor
MTKSPDLARPELSRPEFDIVRALWKLKRGSVRMVHDYLVADTAWAYTTTKTVMDRMVAKGLLERAAVDGVAVYTAKVSRAAGMAKWVDFFANRILERDVSLVLSLIKEAGSISDTEMTELERLVGDDA